MNPRMSGRCIQVVGLWIVAVSAVSWPIPGNCQLHLEQQFTRIDTTQGLAHNSVYDILQDRRGFLWFATEDGL
ncbi:MAG: hypothetical protein KAJ78_10345, partial [Acidobacteria bacterium]|nr:hypothetical protein [Acidobacteriota bacterium]